MMLNNSLVTLQILWVTQGLEQCAHAEAAPGRGRKPRPSSPSGGGGRFTFPFLPRWRRGAPSTAAERTHGTMVDKAVLSSLSKFEHENFCKWQKWSYIFLTEKSKILVINQKNLEVVELLTSHFGSDWREYKSSQETSIGTISQKYHA